MPSPFRSRRALSLSIALLAVAVVGALFAAVEVSSGGPENTIALASQSRTQAACPAGTAKNVNVRSKVGTYVDARGTVQHHGDGQEPFVPANCSPSTTTTRSTVAVKPQRVACPSVAGALPKVPARASKRVKKNLSLLKSQIAKANALLAVRPRSATFVQSTVLKPLKAKRVATINRIGKAIGRTATRPATRRNLLKLATCTVTPPVNRTVAEPVNSGAFQPPVANPGQGQPSATQPPAANPGQAQPPATQPSAANPGQAQPPATQPPAANPGQAQPPAAQPPAAVPPQNPPGKLDVLAKDCSQSKLAAHDGFQNGNRCVSTSFGEVGEAARNPSLVIQDAPTQIKAGQTFQIAVSTRNLVRDRFLAAGQGGYYVESSLLNDQGLVRGHFHTACRILQGNEAQDPAPAPAFFVATEDGSGGAQPDTVRVTVAGLNQAGTAQCAVWAGDGSHRVPMMQRANQVPAFDVVRIQVQ